jgi:hypothetical protein
MLMQVLLFVNQKQIKMKIYGVMFSDCQGYNSLVSNLFKLRLDAMMEAHALANRYNEEHNDDFQLEDDGLTWRDGWDTLTVVEYELI